MSNDCLNCGGSIASWKRRHSKFCSPKCRNVFWHTQHTQSAETTVESVERYAHAALGGGVQFSLPVLQLLEERARLKSELQVKTRQLAALEREVEAELAALSACCEVEGRRLRGSSAERRGGGG